MDYEKAYWEAQVHIDQLEDENAELKRAAIRKQEALDGVLESLLDEES